MPDQESFWKQIVAGDMPQPHYAPYQEFLSHVPGDHLMHIIFACGCWRFIEVRAVYRGRGMRRLGAETLLTRHDKYEYTWSYFYPTKQVDCGARVVDESWLRRRLRVFSLKVGYNHGYADHVFRGIVDREIKSQREIVGDLAR